MAERPFPTLPAGDPAAAGTGLPADDPAAGPRPARAPRRPAGPTIDLTALIGTGGDGVTWVRDEISVLRHNHEMLYDAIADAAFLAGHQVQWVQTARRTQKTEPTVTAFFVEIALSFLPFAALADTLVKRVLTTVIDRALRTRRAFGIEALRSAVDGTDLRRHAEAMARDEARVAARLGQRAGTGAAREIVDRHLVAHDAEGWRAFWRERDALLLTQGDLTEKTIRDVASKPTSLTVEDFLTTTSDVRRYYAAVPIDLFQAGASAGATGLLGVTTGPDGLSMPKIFTAMGKIAGTEEPKPPPTARPHNNAIVAIVGEILDVVRHQKAVQNHCFDRMENRSGEWGVRVLTDAGFAAALTEHLRSLAMELPTYASLRPPGSPGAAPAGRATYAAVRDRLARYFEACMWAHILELPAIDPRQVDQVAKTATEGIDELTREYLLTRLHPLLPLKGGGTPRDHSYYLHELITRRRSGADELQRLAAEAHRSVSAGEMWGDMDENARATASIHLVRDLLTLRERFERHTAELAERVYGRG